MPPKPLKACATPLCPNLSPNRLCDECDEERRLRYESSRATDHAFYHSRAWRTARRRHLQLHPFCADCEDEGLVTAATVVDHVKTRREAPELELDPDNLRSSCKPHHDRKTAKHDGGFGNARRTPVESVAAAEPSGAAGVKSHA